MASFSKRFRNFFVPIPNSIFEGLIGLVDGTWKFIVEKEGGKFYRFGIIHNIDLIFFLKGRKRENRQKIGSYQKLAFLLIFL